MKLSLRNERGHVRDGWKALFFVLAAMACFAITGIVGHRLPISWRPFAPSAILATVLALAVTRAATHLENTTLASVGLSLDGRFLRDWIIGVAVGAAIIAASAAAVCTLAGVRLDAAAGPTLPAALHLIAMFLAGAIFEELLFRGFAFQRAIRGIGTWPAILVFGLLFCVGHLPGNLDVGAALLATAMANLFAFAVLLSLLFLRTRSLAVPIGLHFGWNLLQACLGFGVSGISHSDAWFRVTLGHAPGWLSGGEFGLEASIFALVLQVALIAITIKATPKTSRELRGQPA